MMQANADHAVTAACATARWPKVARQDDAAKPALRVVATLNPAVLTVALIASTLAYLTADPCNRPEAVSVVIGS